MLLLCRTARSRAKYARSRRTIIDMRQNFAHRDTRLLHLCNGNGYIAARSYRECYESRYGTLKDLQLSDDDIHSFRLPRDQLERIAMRAVRWDIKSHPGRELPPENAGSLTGINTRGAHRPMLIMNRLRPDRAIRVGAIVLLRKESTMKTLARWNPFRELAPFVSFPEMGNVFWRVSIPTGNHGL